MGTELTQYQQVQLQMADAIASGQVSTAEDIAAMFNVPSSQVIALLNNDKFLELVSLHTKAKLNLLYNGPGVARIEKIIKTSDDDKLALKAIELVNKLNGNLKNGNNIEIHLEGLLEKSETEKRINNKNFDTTEIQLEQLIEIQKEVQHAE